MSEPKLVCITTNSSLSGAGPRNHLTEKKKNTRQWPNNRLNGPFWHQHPCSKGRDSTFEKQSVTTDIHAAGRQQWVDSGLSRQAAADQKRTACSIIKSVPFSMWMPRKISSRFNKWPNRAMPPPSTWICCSRRISRPSISDPKRPIMHVLGVGQE